MNEYLDDIDFKGERQKAGLSQTEFANTFGISLNAVIKYEKNGRIPVDLYRRCKRRFPNAFTKEVTIHEKKRPVPKRYGMDVYYDLKSVLKYFDITIAKLAKKCNSSRYLITKYAETGKIPVPVYDEMHEMYPEIFPQYKDR